MNKYDLMNQVMIQARHQLNMHLNQIYHIMASIEYASEIEFIYGIR